MTHEAGTHLIGRQEQLTEELLSGGILIGIHVQVPIPQMFDVGWLQEGGTRDGHRLVSGREQGPTVACPLGQEEGFALSQPFQNRKVIHTALTARRESEPGRTARQVPALDPHQLPLQIEIGDLQPVRARPVPPAREPAPTHHPRVEPSLLKEETTGGRTQEGVFEETLVAGRFETFRRGRFNSRLPRLQADGTALGQPAAALHEVQMQHLHGQVDHIAMGSTDKATEAVVLERERGMMVGMERTETLMPHDLQAEPPGDCLDGQFAELENVGSIHIPDSVPDAVDAV